MPKSASLLDTLKNDPATKALAANLGQYAAARVSAKVSGAGQPKKGTTKGSSDEEESSAVPMMDRLKGGAMSGAGEAMQSGTNKVFGGITGAVKGLFSRKGKGKAAKRPTNIIECYPLPFSAEDAYDRWTQYEDHPGYMKGIEKVSVKNAEGEDDQQVINWTAKIFLNRRSWETTTEEDVRGERIRWVSKANKGTVDGTIMFLPSGERSCNMFIVLEYRPKGFFEWWGNRWRTVGRRTRLDIKHWIRHNAMLDQSEDEEDTDTEEETVTDEPREEEGPEQEETEAQPESQPEPEAEEEDEPGPRTPKTPLEVDR